MSGQLNDSTAARGLVIELTGPLIDDRGALARTFNDVLAREQVVLRPGAVEQLTGAAVAWAVTTLLEGHGRFEIVDRVPDLASRIEREWRGMARAGLLRPALGSFAGWDLIDESCRLLVLFGGPATLAAEMLDGCGFETSLDYGVGGGGSDGLPRPDPIRRWLAEQDLDPRQVRAAVQSPAAALAAAAAGLGEVCLIAPTRPVRPELPIDKIHVDLEEFMTST